MTRKEKKPHENNENGNAIFLILIAIFLLGALTFTFTNQNRGSTSIITDTQAEAYATQIIAYGNDVKQAIKRLTLRGCADTEISFENNIVAGYTNGTAPSDNSCHVFETDGGGLTNNPPNDIWHTASATPEWRFSGSQWVDGAGTDSVGDLTLFLRDLNSTVCAEINEKIGITAIGPFPTDASGVLGMGQFTGSYGTGNPPNNSDVSIREESMACVHLTVPDYYLFYKVLIAR